MIKHAVGFLSGAVFGLGLAISEMMNPEKVLAFLDVSGDWDPSLALVMGGAVAVTLMTFSRVLNLKSPLFASRFEIPGRSDVDTALIIGAVIFGIGWGIAGYYPGPAVAALSIGAIEPWVFIVAFIAGNSISIGFEQLQQRLRSAV